MLFCTKGSLEFKWFKAEFYIIFYTLLACAAQH